MFSPAPAHWTPSYISNDGDETKNTVYHLENAPVPVIMDSQPAFYQQKQRHGKANQKVVSMPLRTLVSWFTAAGVEVDKSLVFIKSVCGLRADKWWSMPPVSPKHS
jgi:hypothetical protein